MSLLLIAMLGCKDGSADDTSDTGTIPGCDQAEMLDFFADADGDGYGDADSPLGQACEAPSGGTNQSGDCDDADPAVHPDADELCDDVDNDCDGLVDESGEARTWYADDDDDGFGRDVDPLESCESVDGWTLDAGDCDDTDPAIHPHAEEICDGLDNDCDSATSEEDTVSFDPGTGVLEDMTAELQGTDGAPAVVKLEQAGELHFCPGTFFANLELAANLALTAEEGVVLDGGGTGPVLLVEDSGLTVSISDLTVQGGVGASQVGAFQGVGGGVACTGEGSTVTVSGTTVRGNTGTGVAAEGCALSFDGSAIEDNEGSTGGGLLVGSASLTLVDSTVSGNVATDEGGGIALAGSAVASLTGTLITGNTATRGAGLWLGDESNLTCTGDADTSAGSVANGASESGGGAELETVDGVLTSFECDWGTEGGGDDSSPQDVHVLGKGYFMEDDATFVCQNGTCGESVRYGYGSTWSTVQAGGIIGNTIEATGTGSIDSFEIEANLAACSTVDWAVATGSGSAGTWTVVWSNTATTGVNGNNSSGSVDLITSSGTWYALLVHPNGCGDVTYGMDFPIGIDVGLGTVEDYFVADSSGGAQTLRGSEVQLKPGRHDRSMLLYGAATTTAP